MKYNPDKHHRRSIRLQGYDYSSSGAYFITICTHQRQCLFGEIVDGEMQLNALGQMVSACWHRLSFHFPYLNLDAFVIMPNHIHGILMLTNSGRGAALGQNSEPSTDNSIPNATPPKPTEPGVACGQEHSSGRGAALGQGLEEQTEDSCPNATPNSSEPGVAFGQEMVEKIKDRLPNAAPLPPRLISGSIGAIVLNFKSVTARSRNRIQRSSGALMWQRNYYEHIVRNDESLHRLRQYIQNNPLSWQDDQLHPDNPSKW